MSDSYREFNIINSWLEIELASGRSRTEIMADLADDFDTPSYSNLARLGNWVRGERPIPLPVYEHMLRVVIADAIAAEGGTPPPSRKKLDRLVDRLSMPTPKPKGGQ
jgi:hypothetical protein